MVGFFSTGGVILDDFLKIELINNIADQSNQMIIGYPLAQVHRNEFPLFRGVFFEFRHIRTPFVRLLRFTIRIRREI
ncbi:hypothetical protein M5W75_02670, partial [Paenibacillus larvae]